MDIGFVLVADKKFGFSVRDQRNLSFFDISLGSDGKIRQRPFEKNYLFQMCILF